MCAALVGGLTTFCVSLAAHVIVWRVRRPESYRLWLPILGVVFGPVALAVAWLVAPTPMHATAVLLLQGTLAAVYIIGYTLVSAFSPSVELLKLLDRNPAGIPASALHVPSLAGALTVDRIDNLKAAGLVCEDAGRLKLGHRGTLMTNMVLLYRHAIGLRDGGGG